MSATKKNLVNPQNAKTKTYAEVLIKSAQKNVCPFCVEHFDHSHTQILLESTHWQLCPNNWPYDHSQFHFILVAKRHLELFSELTAEDWQEVHELAQKIQLDKKIQGGGLILRFGDLKYSGATVAHLHFHLVVPKLGEVVYFPIG